MSDPVGFAADIADLPCGIAALNRVVQGLLVHSDFLADYGLDGTSATPAARTTLPVADRVADVLRRDASPLRTGRPPARRSVGTCRDFALILCSFLRSKGVPSRMRCGFASYFGTGWEDHWVCEYLDPPTQGWRLSDPQVDAMLTGKYRIDFDPADIPRERFLTAGEAWTGCRRGGLDPDRFGHGEATGPWFVKVNVVRDHYVLNGREISAWDGWRAAPAERRTVRDHEVELLDRLASQPDQPTVEIAPDWPA